MAGRGRGGTAPRPTRRMADGVRPGRLRHLPPPTPTSPSRPRSTLNTRVGEQSGRPREQRRPHHPGQHRRQPGDLDPGRARSTGCRSACRSSAATTRTPCCSTWPASSSASAPGRSSPPAPPSDPVSATCAAVRIAGPKCHTPCGYWPHDENAQLTLIDTPRRGSSTSARAASGCERIARARAALARRATHRARAASAASPPSRRSPAPAGTRPAPAHWPPDRLAAPRRWASWRGSSSGFVAGALARWVTGSHEAGVRRHDRGRHPRRPHRRLPSIGGPPATSRRPSTTSTWARSPSPSSARSCCSSCCRRSALDPDADRVLTAGQPRLVG